MKLTTTELAERIEAWQQRLAPLGIAHFRIDAVVTTDDVPGKPFSHAGVTVATDYDNCTFYFNCDYVDGASAKDLDETILHEWVHVAMRDLNNATNLAREWLPDATWTTFDENLDHHKETLTDRVARALYALYKPASHPRSGR